MPPRQPDLRGGTPAATLILVSLACIGVYVMLVNHQQGQLAEQLHLERRRRRDAEEDARKVRGQLDGALGTIHRLNPDAETGSNEPDAD